MIWIGVKPILYTSALKLTVLESSLGNKHNFCTICTVLTILEFNVSKISVFFLNRSKLTSFQIVAILIN